MGRHHTRFVPKAVTLALLRTQGSVCPACGELIRRSWASADHVVPLALGGADAVGNLLAMHGDCNTRKGDRLPTGCELVWLLAVNARLGVGPQRWSAAA